MNNDIDKLNHDIEKFGNELKKEIEEQENSNGLISIPEENVYMEFTINNQNYIVFTEDSKDTEEMEIMFAKVDFIDGKEIIRNIETEEEYQLAINEFNRRLELISE